MDFVGWVSFWTKGENIVNGLIKSIYAYKKIKYQFQFFSVLYWYRFRKIPNFFYFACLSIYWLFSVTLLFLIAHTFISVLAHNPSPAKGISEFLTKTCLISYGSLIFKGRHFNRNLMILLKIWGCSLISYIRWRGRGCRKSYLYIKISLHT